MPLQRTWVWFPTRHWAAYNYLELEFQGIWQPLQASVGTCALMHVCITHTYKHWRKIENMWTILVLKEKFIEASHNLSINLCWVFIIFNFVYVCMYGYVGISATEARGILYSQWTGSTLNHLMTPLVPYKYFYQVHF